MTAALAAASVRLNLRPALKPWVPSAIRSATRSLSDIAFAMPEKHGTESTVYSPPFRPVETRKGICVAGAGRMGQIRSRDIMANPGTFVSSIVDPDRQKAKSLAQQLNVPANWSLGDAVTDPLCHAVWIAGPTPLHLECIRVAAEAGKGVAVEKPVAGSVQDILESHATCEANGVPLYCSFQRRVDRSYMELAAAVRGGAIGAVQSVHAVFRDHPVPSIDFLKKGGDIFHDVACHDIDFVCFGLGLGEPCEVYATANSFLQQLEEVGVKDSAHCLFTFPSGAVFTLEMSRCSAYGYDNRLEVMGENGMLALGNPSSSEIEVFDKKGRERAPPHFSFPQRFREAYADEVVAFEQALRGESKPAVTCHDSCRTTHIAEHASISARLGRPVSISFEGMEAAAALS